MRKVLAGCVTSKAFDSMNAALTFAEQKLSTLPGFLYAMVDNKFIVVATFDTGAEGCPEAKYFQAMPELGRGGLVHVIDGVSDGIA